MAKFNGSYEATGYIVLTRKVCGKAVRNADGTLLGYDLDEGKSGKNGKELYLFRSGTMPREYDTTDCEDSWHMVQYSGNAAFFKSEAEAEAAFGRYLEDENNWVKSTLQFAPHTPFQKEDLFVRIMKVHYFVGMEEIQ